MLERIKNNIYQTCKGVSKMKNIFNLSKIGNIFASKRDKVDDQKHIESKLKDANKGEKEPDSIMEKQLEKNRSDSKTTLIEGKLEKSRSASKASDLAVTEKMLNDSNSKIMQHRNVESASGVINKLEEQRLARGVNVPEKEKAEPSSVTEEKQLFYKTKSPDGLKLAQKQTKKASMEDFDIVLEGDFDEEKSIRELERERDMDPASFYEEKAPNELIDLEEDLPFDIKEELKKFKEYEDVGELELDPDFLHSVFTHRTIAQRDVGGTEVEQVEVEFDLRDEEGDIMEMFKSGNHVDREKVIDMLLSYINLNTPEQHISANNIELDDNIYRGVGRATYFAPVM
jgi:hypothetical protein